jgi:NAD-dependent deacetylase
LHGEITWAYGKGNPNDRIYIEYRDIKLGDLSPQNRQLRPDIVWFGEAVPKYDEALEIIKDCEILIVVGTSLNVYPAAGLIHFAPAKAQKFVVDPHLTQGIVGNEFQVIQKPATLGIPHLVQHLLNGG